NTDASQVRTDQITTINSQNGDVLIYEIPCDNITGDFVLIEVVRNEHEEGKYTISLRMNPDVHLSNSEIELACTGDEYEVLNLPLGATVTWNHSSNLILSTLSGQSTTITSILSSSNDYLIGATIQYNGCQLELEKMFEGIGGSQSSFVIEEMIPACYPPAHPFA